VGAGSSLKWNSVRAMATFISFMPKNFLKQFLGKVGAVKLEMASDLDLC
jgi:hypothetical protein